MISYTFKHRPVSDNVRHDDLEISVYNKSLVYFNWTYRKIRQGEQLTEEELSFLEKYGLNHLLTWKALSPKDKNTFNEILELYKSFWELYYFHYEDLCLYAIMYCNIRFLSPRIADVPVVRFFVSHAKEIIGFKKQLKESNSLRSQVAFIYHKNKAIFTSTFSKYLSHENMIIETRSGKIHTLYEMRMSKSGNWDSDIDTTTYPTVGINNLTDRDCSIIMRHRLELQNEYLKADEYRIKESYSEWDFISNHLKYYGVSTSLKSVSNANLGQVIDKDSWDILLSENDRYIVCSWCLMMKRRYEAKAKEEAEKLEKQRLIEAEKEKLREEQKRKEEEARREKYRFNEKNRHNRDSLIAFDAEKHQYSVNGAVLQSVTNFVDGCFPKFDSETMATKTAIKLGVSKQSVLDMWEKKGKESREAGTLMHKKIENYYHGLTSTIDDAYKLFKVFADKMDLKPYRTEWAVFDLKNHIAGTIDFVDFQNGEYIIYDWKRSEKIIDNGMPVKINKYGEKGKYPLEHLDNTPYYHYALQLSLYKYILEKNYGIKISDLRLGIFHPSYDKPYILRMPYLEKEINELFDLRSEVIF